MSKNNPNFSIIIPNYNGSKFLIDCLKSLHQSIVNCHKSQFEIIFIDNNSTDNSIEIFEKIIPKNFSYRILLNSKNKGFAPAVNQGIKAAKHDWVILLNNDLIMEPNWFQLVSKEIKKNNNKKISTFFGTVLNKEGTKFESQGFKFFIEGRVENISNGQKFNKLTINNRQSNQLVWGANASLIIYNKKIITKIGLFDEAFFAYLEDVDVALRLHNLKYQTKYIPQAISYHLGGGTSNTMKNIRSRLSYRNWFYVIIKNYSIKEIVINLPKIFIERLRNLSYFYRQTNNLFIFLLDFFKTSFEIIVNYPQMMSKRKKIEKLLKSNK